MLSERHSILSSSSRAGEAAMAGEQSWVQQCGAPGVKSTLWYPGSVKQMAVTSGTCGNFFQSMVIGGAVVTNQTLMLLSAA